MEEVTFKIKRGFTDHIARALVFNEHFLKFQDKDIVNNLHTIIQKDDIAEYRFGIRWISFRVTYGREYQIYARSRENKLIKITFKSYFGRRKKILNDQYFSILDAFWNFYFSGIVDEYISKHNRGETFAIGDVHFDNEGISINVSGIFKQNRAKIRWENVRTKNYYRYFAVFSQENPAEINRGYNYLTDWNTSVLYSVLRTILREKGIESYAKPEADTN